VQPGFVAAAYPVWSSDSRHLLFLGNRDNEHPPEQSVDWWVTPLDTGPAVKTGALEATRAAKLTGTLQVYSWALVEPAWEPAGRSLIFSARHGDSTNLWRIGISKETFKVTGPPQRVTSGPTREERPSIASGPGGSVRVAFASLNENLSIWSLPIETNRGTVVGEPKRLTQDAADDFQPALSSDGARMVFVSTRSGHQEVWVRDMRTGEESALTATRSMKYAPRFSPDGAKVGFAEAGTWNTYVMPGTGGAPEMVCEGCGQLTGWSSDGKRILCNALDGRVILLNLESRRKTTLITRTGHWLCCGRFSPDDRWITFLDGTAGRTDMVSFRGEEPIREGASIEIIDGDQGHWSSDGHLVYTLSGRDGYICIWAQRLDSSTRRPAGAPFAVFHSHNARLSLSNQSENSLGIGHDQIVFNMGERRGTIWMAEWKDR
jgi:Tol biopolymer transport system component